MSEFKVGDIVRFKTPSRFPTSTYGAVGQTAIVMPIGDGVRSGTRVRFLSPRDGQYIEGGVVVKTDRLEKL